MHTISGRLRTAVPNYDMRNTHQDTPVYLPKRPRSGSVATTTRGTAIRANCGCGWTKVTNNSVSIPEVLDQAFEHNAQTGHTVDINGIIR